MAILKPSPSSPTRWAAGTRTPSRFTIAVGWLFHPSLCSGAPKLRPSAPFSTRKQVMPPGPEPGSPVRAMMKYTSAAPAPEMKALEPERT